MFSHRAKALCVSSSALALGLAAGYAAPAAARGQPPAATSGRSAQAVSKPEHKKHKNFTEPAALSEVIVTGTNIRGVKPVIGEETVITRQQAEMTGLTNPADILRQLPQVQNGGVLGNVDYQGGTANQLYNGSQMEGINLRGLGSGATLILVDGHRTVAGGATATGVDANQVPLAALERIEVVTDGASAIYGSDAVSGVVNYVVRKDYNGVEASARFGNQFGSNETVGDLTAGKSWTLGTLGAGNLLISYEHEDRDPYLEGSNPYLRQNLTQFGGGNREIGGSSADTGFAPNIVVSTPTTLNSTIPRALGNVYYGLPLGANVGLTASQLLLNQPNLVDNSDYTDFFGRQKRDEIFAYLNQNITPNLEFYTEANFSDRHTDSDAVSDPTVTLSPYLYDPATGAPLPFSPNPYYVYGVPGVSQGFPGLIPAGNLSVQYSTLKDFGPYTYLASSKFYNVTMGLRERLPGGWQGETFYTYGHDHDCDECIAHNVNATALQYQVNIGAINPLSSVALTPAQIASYTAMTELQSNNRLNDAVAKFNGALFNLPGGAVRAAFGAEYQNEVNANRNIANSGADNAVTAVTTYQSSRYSRTVWSGFGELYAPLVGGSMNVPAVKSLVFSAAAREDAYSDAGSAVSPKLGLRWVPIDGLKVSGTWGRSFRAPDIAAKNPMAAASGSILPLPNNDPRVTNGAVDIPGIATFAYAGLILGSNPALQSEHSTNYSISVAFDKGPFHSDVSYYDIRYIDQIGFPATLGEYLEGLAPNYQGWGSYIIPIHNPPTCSNSNPSSADPALQSYLKTAYLYDIAGSGGLVPGSGLSNFCSIDVLLDSRLQNLAATEQSGLDFSTSYARNLGPVLFNASGTATVILKNSIQAVAGSPSNNYLGAYGNPVKWRGMGTVGAFWHGFDANLTGHYIGSYLNNQRVDAMGSALPAQKVGSYTTFDLNLGYRKELSGKFGLEGWRASVTILNLFDSTPPLALTASSVVNLQYGIPFGRTFAAQLTADLF